MKTLLLVVVVLLFTLVNTALLVRLEWAPPVEPLPVVQRLVV